MRSRTANPPRLSAGSENAPEPGAPPGPPDTAPAPDGRGDAPEEWIGPYRIVQTIGEGGLGVVYLAEQERPLRRKVAIKILKTGPHVAEVAARFKSEIRTLVALDHPNVTRALDAGTTDDGRPYCVMEYVPGIPINDYCDRNRLTIRRRLGLFVQVCAAIHHAHQKAIIHRDIKASNVLVAAMDGQAIPKVIDFGIVKAMHAPVSDEPLVTHHGALVGTPEYMSPEQAEMTALAVDTRSDIYSLGALLHELLVGALPFESDVLRQAGRAGIPRMIRESDLAPLPTRLDQLGARAGDIANRRRTTVRALRRALRGELDWIVARAMDKDPARRYGSASELGADIQRFLDREPVAAGPGSSVYRLRAFVRRHRPMVVTAAVAVIALLVGFFEISTGLVLQRRARIEAQRDVQRVDAVLEHIVRSVGEGGATAGDAVTARAVLDAAGANLGGVFAHEPEAEASSHSMLGRLYHSLGDRREAESHLRRALVLRKSVLGPQAPLTVESMGHLGLLLMDDQQADEADLLLTQALQASLNTQGENHPRTIAAASHLGRLRAQQGRLEEASELSGRALASCVASGSPDPRRLATLRREHGECLMLLERYAEAEPHLLESVGDFKALLGEGHVETRRTLQDLAGLYERWGLPEKAAAYGALSRDDARP